LVLMSCYELPIGRVGLVRVFGKSPDLHADGSTLK
jgi:hypothetical protein